MKRLLGVAVAALSVVVLGSAAGAHVTIQPAEAPAEAFFKFDVRVPNERDGAATTEVTVRFPDLVFVSFQPKEGWKRKVTMRKLDKPIEVFGTTYDEVVGSVTWSGGRIGPGEFDDFGFSARVPDQAGSLEFQADQTYSTGEVVRWRGPADSEQPAPVVNVVSLDIDEEAGPLTLLAELESSVTTGDDEDDSDTMPLILGGVGAISGLVALAVALTRKRG